MQGCLWIRLPSDDERFIFVGDDKKVAVEAIGTFRLQLKTEFYLDLFETFVVPSFRRDLISIFSLDKFGFSCSFGNNKVSLYQNSKELKTSENWYIRTFVVLFQHLLGIGNNTLSRS